MTTVAEMLREKPSTQQFDDILSTMPADGFFSLEVMLVKSPASLRSLDSCLLAFVGKLAATALSQSFSRLAQKEKDAHA